MTSSPGPLDLAVAAKSPAAARQRVREWARAFLALPPDATVMVNELACAEPGCPDWETVVAAWLPSGARLVAKLPKRAAEIEAHEVEAAVALGRPEPAA